MSYYFETIKRTKFESMLTKIFDKYSIPQVLNQRLNSLVCYVQRELMIYAIRIFIFRKKRNSFNNKSM